ncbi:hypothetical protein ACIREM_05210 [Streptomyces shenzhenensis]|uniref:hypothetical protein n=1 Tax=Streptomyces shenzhenensis TaxID=943815 RepID=UPI0037F7E052
MVPQPTDDRIPASPAERLGVLGDEHSVEFVSVLGPQGERVHIKAGYRPDDPR